MSSTIKRKIEANAYLPKLAEGIVCGEVSLEELVVFFQRYAHLYSVGIDVNAICNLSCDYCYLDSYNLQSAPRYADLSHFERFINEAATRGIDLIAIVGKEPFADTRGIQLLEFLDSSSAHGKEFRFGVVTNGTLVHRFLHRLPRSIAYIDISLDGPPQINDAARGKGVFEKSTKNMRLLLDNGFNIWVSSVLHRAHLRSGVLREFLIRISSETGCGKFYFSPVRNFTGILQPFLLSFEEIGRLQDELTDLAEKIHGVELVILDHPYEAVWRDYFWPLCQGTQSRLDELFVDGYGNTLERLGSHCFRKLDVFPHGPWATCRLDARGEYLPDVESRTFAHPPSVGSICEQDLNRLFRKAISRYLEPLIMRFLENMRHARSLCAHHAALESVSIPRTNNSSRLVKHEVQLA